MRARWDKLEVEGEGPGERSSHCVSAVGGRVYVLGGEKEARVPLPMSMFSFDAGASKLEWRVAETAGQDSPPSRNAHAQAVLGTDIYVHGGRQGVDIGEKALSDLWKYDTLKASWQEVQCASGDIPEPRSYHVMTALDGDLYLFGGCGEEGRLADFHAFSPAAGAWRRLNDPPVAGRGGATLEAIAASGKIFLFSGFEGKESKDCLTYDVGKGEWTVHEKPGDFMVERSVCSSVTRNSDVIVFGGETKPSDKGHDGAGNFENRVFLFSGSGSGSVAELQVGASPSSGSPAPRGWSSGALVKDSMAVFYGGLTGDDKDPQRLGDCWALRFEDS